MRRTSVTQNMWPEKDGDVTAAFIGCPHNTYYVLKRWGKMVAEALLDGYNMYTTGSFYPVAGGFNAAGM